MGLSTSIIESEKKSWKYHNLEFDASIRDKNLQILQNAIKDGETISICFCTSTWDNFQFQHWFLTTQGYFLEFGGINSNIYNARVTINKTTRDLKKINTVTIDSEMRQRIHHVIGMSNYSLLLRNCEHVANYIFRNRWISSQVDEHEGNIYNVLKKYIEKYQVKLINTFPSTIQPHIFSESSKKKMYSFIDDSFEAFRFDYYLDSEEDTYNILVIGPTGAGKSHLINVFFNQEICDSKVSHASVTREIYFVRGKGRVYDLESKQFEMKNVVVADTIGLCDTEWNEQDIINMIKSRISSNFQYIDAVYIVFRADRLLQTYVQNITKILDWLHYYDKSNRNHLRFLFVGTYADFLKEQQKDQLRAEATKIFKLRETNRAFVEDQTTSFNSLIYTGFPPEEALNDLTKQRLLNSWKELKYLTTLPGNTKRIDLKNNFSCTIV